MAKSISANQSTGDVVARTLATNIRRLASMMTPIITPTAATLPAAAENQWYAFSDIPSARVQLSGINIPITWPPIAAKVA